MIIDNNKLYKLDGKTLIYLDTLGFILVDRIYDILHNYMPVVIGDLPPTTDDVAAIMEYDSEGITDYFGGTKQQSVLYPIIKIVSRTSQYAVGNEWMNIIKQVLHKYHDDDILSCMMVRTPIYLGKGSTSLHEFQITFKIIIKE